MRRSRKGGWAGEISCPGQCASESRSARSATCLAYCLILTNLLHHTSTPQAQLLLVSSN